MSETSQAGDESKNGSAKLRRAVWNKKVSKVLTPVLGALAGAVLTVLVQQYANRLRYVDYYVSSAASLIPKMDLRLLIAAPSTRAITTQPVDNISTVQVNIFNDTGVDYTDVPVIVRFEPVDGQRPKVIRSLCKSPPEIVKESPAEDMNDASLRLRYDVRKLNRRDLITLDYVFVGGTPPEVSLTSISKGVEMKRAVIAARSEGFSWLSVVIACAAGSVTGYYLGLWMMSRSFERVVARVEKRREQLAEEYKARSSELAKAREERQAAVLRLDEAIALTQGTKENVEKTAGGEE